MEDLLISYSPHDVVLFSFGAMLLLTLFFAYVVIEPRFPTGIAPYKTMSVTYMDDKEEDDKTVHDEPSKKRAVMREIEREIQAANHGGLRNRNASQRCRDRAHPAPVWSSDWSIELKQLAAFLDSRNIDAMRDPLQRMHDCLVYFKAPGTRDMNKASILCKALVKHDGLDLLRRLQDDIPDEDIRSLAQAVLESAVGTIWS
ncbi:unnamed protein product [Aphanomyces euteiches]|uniref:Transmembrane protein n=1 Tax=Aphanomyces euteiches TaxID=100861 RepID=A0A6G0WK43_9STRA|nr:hypothetical protein Ae201684_014435 [Aphanomyces euteiches]KAH9088845.1 hypothetical protein Ae201684P_013059 [Aphanomyces euteiches]KAH9158151.1 hypothetical protein AeRB84_000092 [Aphanomyces euteiches]